MDFFLFKQPIRLHYSLEQLIIKVCKVKADVGIAFTLKICFHPVSFWNRLFYPASGRLVLLRVDSTYPWSLIRSGIFKSRTNRYLGYRPKSNTFLPLVKYLFGLGQKGFRPRAKALWHYCLTIAVRRLSLYDMPYPTYFWVWRQP